jgi:hypothetical protein
MGLMPLVKQFTLDGSFEKYCHISRLVGNFSLHIATGVVVRRSSDMEILGYEG